VPELDVAAHASGWESPQWTMQLENVDAAVRSLNGSLGALHGMLVTADHGVIDVPQRNHVLFDTAPALVDGVRHVAGDPRCLHLHIEPRASELQRARLLEAWRAAESQRSWVFTREQLVRSGWLGDVDPAVEPRIGDIIVAARKGIAYYDGRTATTHARAMVGQHGSFSAEEVRVPLLRFGAFAR
jgi:Type I phosphodiesterase / nucleotide pyrophosphatase